MTDRSPGLEPDAASPMRARLRGDLTIDTAGSLLEAGRRWLAEQPAGSVAELDLSGVHRCDSAALVLLVDWLRTARSRGRSEERRVGKECRGRAGAERENEKRTGRGQQGGRDDHQG